ncbi:MAG: hypothetical protein Q7S44_03265 [bacterium]|nr:hypothetical protein [bacterium]
MLEARPCCKCKINPPGGAEHITFEHEGAPVTIFKSGIECPDCTRLEWLEAFQRYGDELVTIQDGRPTINWRFYVNKLEASRSNEIGIHMNHLLVSLGVLSFEPQNSWHITAAGSIPLNPRLLTSHAGFRNFEDATEFARLRYAGTRYLWAINFISKSIFMDEVLAQKSGKSES